jgi:hypothetical protein
MSKESKGVSETSSDAIIRLTNQKRRYDLVNYRTGLEDGYSAVLHGDFLFFQRATFLLHLNSPETFIEAAEASGHSIAVYTAARLSGIEDLDDSRDLNGVTGRFFSAITQREGGEHPPENYVLEFIYGINEAIEQVFREAEESGLDF